jgi:hypothetical protein
VKKTGETLAVMKDLYGSLAKDHSKEENLTLKAELKEVPSASRHLSSCLGASRWAE